MVRDEVIEWFSKADKDIEEAKFLFDNNRTLEHVNNEFKDANNRSLYKNFFFLNHDNYLLFLSKISFIGSGSDVTTLTANEGSIIIAERMLGVIVFTLDGKDSAIYGLYIGLGKNGGYILGPSHAIQAGTPPENILAMFDTALGFYPFEE